MFGLLNSAKISRQDFIRAILWYIVKDRKQPIIYLNIFDLIGVLVRLKYLFPKILTDFLFDEQSYPVGSREIMQIWTNLRASNGIINIQSICPCYKYGFDEDELLKKILEFFDTIKLSGEFETFLANFEACFREKEISNLKVFDKKELTFMEFLEMVER